MNFRRWVVFSFLTQLAVVLLDKGAGIVLWMILKNDKPVKGAADLLTILPFVLMSVANLGLATSLVYFLRRRQFDLKEVTETVSMVALVWGTFVAALAILVSKLLLPLIKPEWEVDLVIVVPICLCTPLLLTTSYFNSIQLAQERIKDYNLVHLISSLAFLPLFLAFYLLTGRNATHGIVFGRLAGAVLITAVTLYMLRDLGPWRPRLHRRFLKAGLVYGWKANVTSVLTYLNHRVDLYLLLVLYTGTTVLGPHDLRESALSQVATYGMSVTFAELVWHFPEATRDLFFSKVAGVTEAHARSITPVLCRLALWLAIGGAVVIYFLIDPVMTLVDSLFKPGAWQAKWSAEVLRCVLVLIPGTACYTIAKVLQADLAARNYLDQCLAASTLVLVVMVTLDVLWIPTHGAVGAAAASSIAYFASSLYSLVAYKWSGGAGYLACTLPRQGDFAYLQDLALAVVAKLRRRRA